MYITFYPFELHTYDLTALKQCNSDDLLSVLLLLSLCPCIWDLAHGGKQQHSAGDSSKIAQTIPSPSTLICPRLLLRLMHGADENPPTRPFVRPILPLQTVGGSFVPISCLSSHRGLETPGPLRPS